jgi:hypothetical protein
MRGFNGGQGKRENQAAPASGGYSFHHNGRRKSKRIGSEAAAREAAKKIEAKLVLREFEIEKQTIKAPTFKELAELWLSLPHDWKQSTRASYKLNLMKHAYPVFGKCPINEIGRKDIKAFFDGLLSKGKSPATVAGIKAPIKGVLVHAVDSELIENNPILNLAVSMRKKKTLVEPLTGAGNRKTAGSGHKCTWAATITRTSCVRSAPGCAWER